MGFHNRVSAKERHQMFFSLFFSLLFFCFLIFSVIRRNPPPLLSASPSETIDESVGHHGVSSVFSVKRALETHREDSMIWMLITVRRGQHDLDADYLNEVGIAFTFSVFIGYDWIQFFVLDVDYLNEVIIVFWWFSIQQDNKEHLSALALSLPDIMVTF